jgi:hypothetical protein
MNKQNIFLWIFVLTGIASFAQDKTEQQVVFDPLFWKSELKLNKEQVHRISEINSGFYSTILNARDARNINIRQLTQNRSEQIWNTFTLKQRKRWRKLEADYETDKGFASSYKKANAATSEWARAKSSRTRS